MMVKEKTGRYVTLIAVMAIAVCLIMVQTAVAQQETLATAQPLNTVSSVSACPAGCECMTEAMAKAKYGTFSYCSNAACGYEQASVSTQATAGKAAVPKYCVRKIEEQATPVPICPAGCACLPEADAKEKGYVPCGGVQKICGYQSLTGTSAETSTTRPLYCYGKPVPSVCPAGCDCMTEAQAKEKFGTYVRCSNAPCMNAPVASAAQVAYCFRKAGEPTETPSVGTANCACSCRNSPDTAAVNLPTCSCTCTKCVYDYQNNRCTGSCGNTNEACQINTVVNNADGTIAYAECHCKKPAGSIVPQAVATPYVISASCDPASGICRSENGVELGNVSKNPTVSEKALGRDEVVVQERVRLAGSGELGSSPDVSTVLQKEITGKDQEQAGEGNSAQPSPDIIRSIGNIIRSFFNFGSSG
ncbi:MAG: hypothetical protein OS112_03735 [Methanoregula sp.]|nr:MAG: hypothetical protein OS112_03735 [Methanoregula sp.]